MSKLLFGLNSNGIFLGFLASVCLVITTLMTPTELNAQCIRQSMMNHDYCGPEGSKLARLVPEKVIGNFKGACAAHDACYAFGGENIVRKMEGKYQKSMTSATKAEMDEFKKQISAIKKSCDRTFLSDLSASCKTVAIMLKAKCIEASVAYYSAVSLFAGKAFERAVAGAFTCRTR